MRPGSARRVGGGEEGRIWVGGIRGGSARFGEPPPRLPQRIQNGGGTEGASARLYATSGFFSSAFSGSPFPAVMMAAVTPRLRPLLRALRAQVRSSAGCDVTRAV